MNISQRQATIGVLGFQLIVIIILWLSQVFAKQGDDLLTLGAGLAMIIYGGTLFAYFRGWEYAPHTSVVLITLVVAAFLPEPFVTTYAPFLILLGPILALVLINPLWVIGSAVATIGLLLLRAGGGGVYASVTTLLNYAMLIAGLIVSRMVIETERDRVEKTEEVLNESQARMEGIINSAMDAIISIDHSQRIALFNPAAEKMFGYAANEIRGQSLDILIPELYHTNHSKQIDNFGQTGITNRHMNGYMEITGVRKNGNQFPIDTSISQIDIDGGKLFTAILRDVTEHKQAQATLQKIHDELEVQFQQRTTALSQATALLETMLEYVPDQIFFKDAESRFIKNSRSQATALGLSDPSLVVGKTDFDFFPHAQRSFDEEQEIIRSGKPLVDFEERVAWPDGKETWVSTTKVPLRNQAGKIIGTFGISRDITDRKRADETLRKARDELEVKVAERTAELSEANKQLQLELNERKRVEEALRENEKQLKESQHIAGLGNYFIDLTTGKWKGSEIFDDLLGIDETFERTMETWPLLIHPNDRQRTIDYFTNEVIGKHIRFDREYRIIRQNDQAERWVHTLGKLEVNAQNQPVKMVGTVQDITESKQRKAQIEYQAYLLKQINNAIIATDEQYHITAWNHGAEILYGWSEAEALGRNSVDLIPSDMTKEEQDEILQQLHERGEYHIELVQYRKDGQPVYVDANTVTIYDESGQVTGLLTVNHDITGRKQAEEEIRKLNFELEARIQERTAELRDLYNNAPFGYHSLNADGVFVRINDTELNWMGYKREELIGKINLASLLSPASVEIFKRVFPIFKEKGWINDLELEIVRKDGSIMPALLSGIVIKDQSGGYLESRTTLIDYTDRKHIEEEMLKSQLQLEAANKELEAFSYSVSHDLRSPLRGIDGWSLALLEDYGNILDEQGKSHLQRVRAETQRMGTLIDDILHLSRITRAEMNKEKVDLSAIAEIVAARLQETKPEDRQVEFGIQKGLTAIGDPHLLDVVLTNLLDNAFKFTSKKQEAHIEFGQTIMESTLVFFVRDNGAGFDMTYANNLFGVFQRMHRVSEFPGTGVGLATVQRIIHRHGGSIWAASEVEKGTTFYFTLEDNK